MLLRIDFGKKDADLKRWKISVQMAGYSVKTLISQMILADLQNTVIILPPIDGTVSVNPTPMSLKFEIRDVIVENHLISLPIYSRSAYIKALIRKNITLNSRSSRRKQAEKCPLSSEPAAEKSPFSAESTRIKNTRKHEKSGFSVQNKALSGASSETAEICPRYVPESAEFCPRTVTDKALETNGNNVNSGFSSKSTSNAAGNTGIAENCPLSEKSKVEMGRKSTGEHLEEDLQMIEYDDVFELEDNAPDMGMLLALAGE